MNASPNSYTCTSSYRETLLISGIMNHTITITIHVCLKICILCILGQVKIKILGPS